MKRRFRARKLLPLALLLGPAAYMAFIHINAYYTVQSGWHDNGLVYNVMAQLWHQGTIPFFQVHLIPFFYLLGPIIHISQTGMIGFIVAHAVALGSVSAVIYFRTRYITNSAVLAACLYIGVAANYYMVNKISGNLHFEVFAMFFLLLFLFLAERRQVLMATLAMLLALSVKEDVWIYAIGIVWILGVQYPKNWRLTLLYGGVVAAYTAIIIFGIYPYLYPNSIGKSMFLSNWPYGESYSEVLFYFLSNPHIVLQNTFNQWGIALLSSFLFIPLLLAPLSSLPLLATMALWLSAVVPIRGQLDSYYSWPALTLAFATFPYCLRTAHILEARLRETRLFNKYVLAYVPALRWSRRRPPLASLLVGLLLAATGLATLVNYSWQADQRIGSTVRQRQVIAVADIVAADPTESVLTEYYLAPYVADRARLYLTHFGVDGAADFLAGKAEPTYVLLDLRKGDPTFPHENEVAVVNFVREDPRYERVVDNDGLVLYRRRDSGGGQASD